ncbi:helix-turn-helix domain-containing protein [Pseudoalteromonas obscura]|uniref:Helix-turn-helix transcriptional regulator n=1 Tax=Pseudoalteromonas obscura TaxID=3048491 RepID=A0ABT7EK33_9GAMM|nr:helix-turn-helix transcriptional regulator [Pseudoalteromonas sp. P94(2023)]MDK2595421.1 helix-turn-helix transcriptional regulator [Pseudoalteromonas sp. P94(2023)]
MKLRKQQTQIRRSHESIGITSNCTTRKRVGLTQAEAAEHYGLEERTLRRWENKESNPDFRDVVGVVEMLNQDFLRICKEVKGSPGGA